MILGGLALAFSRLIDNSVVVLENIFRHMENGESPEVAAERAATKSHCRCWPRRSPPRLSFSR
jgi:multidrug efflux pump subunit AcrB